MSPWIIKPDEGQGGAVQDRHFRALDLDETVVETQAGGGRHDVLDRSDGDISPLERRGVVEGRRRIELGGDELVGMFPAEENEAVIDGGGMEMGSNWVAGMESDAVDRNGRAQCCLLSHALSNASRSVAVTVPISPGRTHVPMSLFQKSLAHCTKISVVRLYPPGDRLCQI